MLMKSPVSSICLEACAKRGSSRSIGGMVAKPGAKARAESSNNKAAVRRFDAAMWATAGPNQPGSIPGPPSDLMTALQAHRTARAHAQSRVHLQPWERHGECAIKRG